MGIQHLSGGAAPTGWWNWVTQTFDAALPTPSFPAINNALVQVASTSIPGQSSLAWSTTTPAGMFTDPNATYRVISFALDQATNDQQNPAQAGAGSTFHYA